jgi:hypothetical protein
LSDPQKRRGTGPWRNCDEERKYDVGKTFLSFCFLPVAETFIDRQLVRESRADKVMIEHLTTEQEQSLNREF